MTQYVVAEFGQSAALLEALRQAKSQGFEPLDTLTPFPLVEIEDALSLGPSPLRWPMLIAALTVAACAYGLQYATAAYLYPLNTGARPLNSWPVFLLAPFEVGVLAAALSGFIAFLLLCRLPRVDHPLFALPVVERVTSDRFALVLAAPERESDRRRLEDLLFRSRALRIGATL